MKTLVATACFFGILATGEANAALIPINDPVYGVGSVTLDTDTNLEWLDLTESTGFSVNDILGGAGGFLANGFQLATLAQVETLFLNGGWDGVDDSASAGSTTHLAFVLFMQSLFGVTGDENGDGPFGAFNEGWALTPVAGIVSRPFNTQPTADTGRVACTTVGFNTFTSPVNSFGSCRMDYDQRFDFIGAYLVRPAQVPEPATAMLIGVGVAAAAFRKRIAHRR